MMRYLTMVWASLIVAMCCSESMAVASSIQNKAADVAVITPEQYGAVGNNVADDTIPIQSALTYASTSGATVFLAPGATYKITGPLYLWGKANVESQGTESLAYGSLRFVGGSNPYLVRVGLSGVNTIQEPWSGRIKHVDFTITSGSAPGRILFFFRTDGGLIEGVTGDARTYRYSLTSSGNDSNYLSGPNYIRKNIRIIDSLFKATGLNDNLGSEGIALADFDGVVLEHNEVVCVGDDPIAVHYSRNVSVRDNIASSVDGRLFFSNNVQLTASGNRHTRCPKQDGTWSAGTAMLYVGHETTATNSLYAPEMNMIANNLLICPSGAIDNNAFIYVQGGRQISILNNTIVNNSEWVTGFSAVSLQPFTFSGTWTDPTGLDTNPARVRDVVVSGNQSIGTYPLSFIQTGPGIHYLNSIVFTNNVGKGTAVYSTIKKVGGNITGDLNTLEYGASMTPDGSLGDIQIVVTNGAPFTINNPANAVSNNTYAPATELTFVIKNTSGGAIGAVTWGSQYVLSAPVPTLFGSSQNRHILITFKNVSVPGVTNGWSEIYRSAEHVNF